MNEFNEPISLNPIHFFSISADCNYIDKDFPSLSEGILPATDQLTGEESFAKVSMGWNEKGIGLLIVVSQAAKKSCFPKVEEGDSVELFFDTRDLKTAGFNTRFCHHFYFLPNEVEGQYKGEKTHFRTEDSHPLCDPSFLICQTELKKKEYKMKIFIPSHCLYGYDPKQLNRLGFTYRINRYGGAPQHFSVMTQEYHIEQQPSLWASLVLK